MGAKRGHGPRQDSLDLGMEEFVARPRLDGIVAEHLAAEGIVALCAGSGMGKTALAEMRVRDVREAGGAAIHLQLSGRKPASACRSIREAARSLLAGRRQARLVVLDDVPSLGEDQLASIERAVRQLVEDGRQVLMCLRPESAQLAQAVDAPIVRASALLVREMELARWGAPLADSPRRTFELTGGIPALVAALRHEPPPLIPLPGGDSILARTMEQLVRASLEGSLMDEERRLRCAMLLMGAGHVGEAQGVVGRSDAGLVAQMQRDEPLFGLNVADGFFQVVGALGPFAESVLRPAAELARAEYPDLARKVVDVLAWRGDFQRCGEVARLCLGQAECRSLVANWSVELLNAGQTELVAAALGASTDADAPPLDVARVALAALVGSREELDHALPLAPPTRTRREQTVRTQAELLLRARSLDAHVPAAPPMEPGGAPDAIVRGLSIHVVARSMLWRGEFSRAFRYLLVGGEPHSSDTVASALLGMDFDVARCLAGDMPSREADDRSALSAMAFAGGGLSDLAQYTKSLRTALAAFAGRLSEAPSQESCLSRAARRGDTLVQAFASLALACCDLRRDALARAHVRAERARSLAQKGGCEYLGLASALVDGIAQERLGDDAPLRKLAAEDDPIAVFSQLALVALGREEGTSGELRASIEALLEGAVDYLPVLQLLAWSCSHDVVHDAISGKWSSRLSQYERAMVAWSPPSSSGSSGGEDSRPASENVVRVRMLGRFDVTVCGRRVSEASWGRRSARHLLMLLAASERHTISRSEAMEAIWPESDYISGRGNLYTALSTLRKALGTELDGKPFITGTTGYLQLNEECVVCDVDEFEAMAQRILSGRGGDRWTVEECERLSALYEGELFVPTLISPEIFLRRRGILRRLYVDAMVTGSEAALRLGDPREAIQLARDAHRVAPLREDAVAALVRGLFATGRVVEAKEAYDEFASSSISVSGMPPSSRLRTLYGSFAGSSNRAEKEGQESVVFEGEKPTSRRRRQRSKAKAREPGKE